MSVVLAGSLVVRSFIRYVNCSSRASEVFRVLRAGCYCDDELEPLDDLAGRGEQAVVEVAMKKITQNINKSEKPCYDVLADWPV